MVTTPELPTGDRRPVPDPTLLTTQQLYREIGSLRELIESRLDGNDKAIVVLQQIASSQPTPGIVMAAVASLKEHVDTTRQSANLLRDEKFAAVQTQFRERDTRTEQSAAATKIAVDAALQAAKEAVAAQNTASAQAIAKSEAATTKQIDAIAQLITAQAKGTDEKIEDVKGRITVIESVKTGGQEQRASSREIFGYVVGAVGLLVGVLSVIGFVLSKG
jgi:hypothetical protein